MPMTRPAKLAVLIGLVVWLLVPAVPAMAIPSDAGSGVTNLAESEGCDIGVAGPARPEVDHYGYLRTSDVLYGPWADFYGRTKAQVQGSTFKWTIFGTDQTVDLHERLRPAAALVDQKIAEARSNGLFYDIDAAASWVWRTVGGTTRVSEHAFGSAIDVNPGRNPYSRTNTLITDMPSWFVDLWRSAGFCWGGQWINVKDAMHFSWNGPVATPGYTGRPAPYPPVTNPIPFGPVAVSVPSVIGDAPGARFALADLSGDGSADLVRWLPGPSGTRVEAAGSVTGFDRIGYRADIDADLGTESLLADHDGDGRADLWLIDDSGGTVRIEVRSHRSGFQDVIARWDTDVPAADDYGLTFYDDDYLVDLVALQRSGPTIAVIWSGASSYTSVVGTLDPDLVDTSDRDLWAPLLGDWDVDGRTDLYLVRKGDRPEVRVVTAAGQRASFPLNRGIPLGARLLISDYDGDGRDDLYVLDGANLSVRLGGDRAIDGSLTEWFVPATVIPWDAGPECPPGATCASIGYVDDGGRWTLADAPASEHETNEFFYGNPGDVPFMGDWDCDGIATPGLYRRSDGYVYLRNANSQGVADVEFFFGNPGDLPLVGDFDGDGCDTVSIFRAAEHRVYIIDRLGSGSQGLGSADRSFTFGDPGDVPFVGDFDGDGRDDVGLHRVSTGRVYLRLEQADGPADIEFVYGDPGDTVVAADWNGDGTDTVAVFRPSDGNWYISLANRPGSADHVVHLHAHGGSTTRPIVGSFRTGP